MVEWFDILRYLHVLGACVLIGTGSGIAFFMLMANRTGDPAFVARAASVVVIADYVFTATAAIAQPVTGYLLAREIGWSLTEPWLALSIFLYVFIGIFWLPVVYIQTRMRNEARVSADTATPLTERYHRLYHVWFLCGTPAFSAILLLLWLMLTKPAIGY